MKALQGSCSFSNLQSITSVYKIGLDLCPWCFLLSLVLILENRKNSAKINWQKKDGVITSKIQTLFWRFV
jgi:hypothetical protein